MPSALAQSFAEKHGDIPLHRGGGITTAFASVRWYCSWNANNLGDETLEACRGYANDGTLDVVPGFLALYFW
jgi:hypothetical protein